MSTDMIVDGGGLSTIQGLRRWSGGRLLTPSTSTHQVGHATHASAIATPVSSAKVQATGPEKQPRRQDFSQWFLQCCSEEPRLTQHCAVRRRGVLYSREYYKPGRLCLKPPARYKILHALYNTYNLYFCIHDQANNYRSLKSRFIQRFD